MENIKLIPVVVVLLGLFTQAHSQPIITKQPTNQVVANGGTAVFSVAVSGTEPFTYQWQLNGTNLPTSGIITTVAGGGPDFHNGDGGAATNATLNSPWGVAVDGTGNLFIADGVNCRIRMVATNGVITTVAGNGTAGYSGDGGAATNAMLYFPRDVKVDGAGNLFIADSYYGLIRKVSKNGIITTVAGNGTLGFSGDGGPATNAMIGYTDGVAVDAFGNLFITDQNNNRIRKVDTTGIITTVAGNSEQGFSGDGGAATNASLYTPDDVMVDNAGNIFIVDEGNHRIRKVDANGVITTVAGNGKMGFSGDGGIATNAMFWGPSGITVDSAGNLYIADGYINRIREVLTNGLIITVAGNGTNGFSGDGNEAADAELSRPADVAMDSAGNLFIADNGSNRVRKVSLLSYPPTYLPTLTLNNISGINAGGYSVVVSNASGSVTSSVVALSVVIPPSIIAPTMLVSGQLQFSFNTVTDVNYAVQYSTNLTQWFPFVTLGGVGLPLKIIVPNVVDSQQRFYRVELSPQ